MIILDYAQVLKLDPVIARKQIIDNYFHKTNRNISKTARLCSISRNTVRKYVYRFLREGEAGLKDRSRRPHTSPRKTPDNIEMLVLEIFKKTNQGFRRIAKNLRRKYGIRLSYGTVRKILKRHNQYKPRKKITIRRTGKRYYNPLDFKPFEFLQIDTKEVIDGDTLPSDTYQHLLDLAKQNVPLYQFTAIDVRTRIRFLAYGQQQSFINGWAYMILLVLWLRSFGITHHIIMQSDWGNEFGGISGKKIAWMNQMLTSLNVEITRIQKGRKEQNSYVERSHRTDDEEFYIPYGLEIKDTNSLFLIAYSWIKYYNTKRDHTGDNLDGKIPIEYTKEIMPKLSSNIALFPPVILDNITCNSRWLSGKDVCEHYIIGRHWNRTCACQII